MPREMKLPSLLDFKDLKEPWNQCKLVDGSVLRVKVVVKNIMKEEEGSYSIGTANVIAIVPNEEYLGLPSPPRKQGEPMESYIEAEDLKILSQTELWNEYELPSEKMKLRIKGVVVTVSRTSRHDDKGLPIYLANVQVLIKPKKMK